jgi:hypothetical protein
VQHPTAPPRNAINLERKTTLDSTTQRHTFSSLELLERFHWIFTFVAAWLLLFLLFAVAIAARIPSLCKVPPPTTLLLEPSQERRCKKRALHECSRVVPGLAD